MKKISKLIALAASLTALFFIGCSDIASSDDDSAKVTSGLTDKTAAATLKDYSVSFYTEEGEPLDLTGYTSSNASTSSRTIVAEALDLSTGVYFYLWGTDALNNSNSITTPKAVNFALLDGETTKGTVSLDLSSSKWNLVLAAAKTSGLTTVADVKADAYYIGYANVDLRDADSIKFYLSASGLAGNGTATLKLVYDGLIGSGGTWTTDHKTAVSDNSNTTGYKIAASIRSRADNTLVGSSQTVTNSEFFDSGAQLTAFTASPGTYNFVVSFTNNATGKSYEWSDIIIILPKQDVAQTIKVPDIIMYAPKAPTAFKVGYIAPSSTDKNSYNAVFTWTDNANNEKYFTIEAVSLPASKAYTLPVADEAVDDTSSSWDTLTGDLDAVYKTTFGEDFYGNTPQGWVAGSLLKNNKGIVAKLALGSRYIIRIAAVNDAGTSTYCYATYDLAAAFTTDMEVAEAGNTEAKTYTPTAYMIKKIDDTTKDYADDTKAAISASLYRLTYHLNGGTYKFAANNEKTTDLVYYLSQEPSTGIPIFTPLNDPKGVTSGTPATTTYTYPILANAKGNRWTSWRDGIVGGVMYTTSTEKTVSSFTYYEPSNYKGFSNLDLYASYTISSAAVEVYSDPEYDFRDDATDGELKITGTGSTKVSNKYYTANSKTATDLVLNYAYSNHTATTRTANVAYDSLTASIKRMSDGVVVGNGPFNSSSNYEFSISNFIEGKYQITVIGEYKGHQYSYSITLEIIDE